MKHFAYVDADGRVRSVCSTTDDLPAFSDEHWIEELAAEEAQKVFAIRYDEMREAFCKNGLVEIRDRTLVPERKKAARLALLEKEVENFISRRKDGSERYPVARQCALHSLLHVCRYLLENGRGIKEMERQRLQDCITSIMKVFAWISAVHGYHYMLGRKIDAVDNQALEVIAFDGSVLDSGEPAVDLEWISGFFNSQSPALFIQDGLK